MSLHVFLLFVQFLKMCNNKGTAPCELLPFPCFVLSGFSLHQYIKKNFLYRYELSKVDVERGKFLLKEDELMKKENSLAKEKTQLAMKRLKKEEKKARQAERNMRTRDRWVTLRIIDSA